MTQIRETIPYPDGSASRRWAFALDGEIIAELLVDVETLVIGWICTKDGHTGQGLARRLYELASAEAEILHAPEEHLSEDGKAFVLAVGGDTAEPCELCQSGEYH